MKSIRPVPARFGAVVWLVLLGLVAGREDARGQGCVASRGSGLSCLASGPHVGEILPPKSGFQASVGYRWLHSDRHFRGDEEEEYRQEEGSEVINDSQFIDLTLTYAFNPQFSASLIVPFSINDRSQVVRSNDAARTILDRFHTQSSGLGDLRLMGNGWILDPAKPRKGNLLIGLGVDMPTGEDDAEDIFQRFDPSTGQIVARKQTVDQSIQPGDGGWGAVIELFGYRQLLPQLSTYINGGYTITPEELNGVPTYRTTNPYESEMSIADSYFGRGGFEYLVWARYGVTLSLGARIDGVRVHDLFGGSDGFRRPGYSVSIEPGLAAMFGDWSFNLYTPVAMYRNRLQSVPDKQWTDATGVYRQGDAAFADWVFIFSLSKRF
ncbi:MAG: hypothetical protein RJA22_36 [Verrucomicrobiota bacterium]|jgi:hypothetical protein